MPGILKLFRFAEQTFIIGPATTLRTNMGDRADQQLVRREISLQLLLHFTKRLRHDQPILNLLCIQLKMNGLIEPDSLVRHHRPIALVLR